MSSVPAMRPLLGIFLTAAIAAADPGLIRPGDDACAAGLWDIGAMRYQAALAGGRLSRAERAEVGIRLAEALVRSDQPDKALALLKESHLASRPEAYFWRGQALAATGRLAEAAEALKPALDRTDATHRAEALLTRASLMLALDRPADALLALKPLTESPDPATAAVAHLRQAEILLDQGGPTAARAIIPESEALPARYRREASLVQGRILLAGGQATEAVRIFRALRDNPARQSLRGFHTAAVGLADALAVAEGPRAALDFLLEHAAAHPEAPLLDEMFERVTLWLPKKPARDDEALATMAAWIPKLPPPPPTDINPRPDAPEAIWPVPRESNPLAPYALHTLALALHRADDAAARAEARILLTRLRLEFPAHPLATQAMIEQARWHLEDGNPAAAAALLAHLPADLPPPGAATFLQAQAAFEQGDAKAAIALFEQAAESLSDARRGAALLNASMLRLAAGLSLAVATGGEAQAPDDPAATPAFRANLQLEQALATTEVAKRKAALDEFITGNPAHPRLAEALLASAETALAETPPDLATARARMAALAALEPPPAEPPEPARVALAKTFLASHAGDPAATIAAATAFLGAFPDHPAAGETRLLLGRALYDDGDFNRARMTLEKLAAGTEIEPARAQAAWLLAARAAVMVPTPQSREEALGLFDKAIAIDAPLASVSRLEKARLLLDLDRAPEVVEPLAKWLETLPKDDALHLPGGLLLGEAVTAAEPESPAALARALQIYERLLKHPATDPASRHRVKFLCAQTLEQLPDPRNPGAKRVPEAIAMYYSVLEEAGAKPPPEWEWFERCGFRAVELYAAARRWQSAIAIARKIASFNGPRAAEAAKQAELLQLKNMVWED